MADGVQARLINMQASKLLGNFAILAISVIVALLLGELAPRLFLNASDFLSLEMVQDDVLGAVPSAAARAGFDRWGFRNREVPASADIVAVGWTGRPLETRPRWTNPGPMSSAS